MINLFGYSDYRLFLNDFVYSPETKRGTQVQIANAIGCQAAYLSQVLKGFAHLTEDQALGLANYLKLSTSGTEYLVLLVRLVRASTPKLRDYLEKQRQRLLSEQEDAARRVQSQEPGFSEAQLQKYFSSWIPSTVHIATSSANFQTLEQLSQRLRIEKTKIVETLELLKELGLVKEDKMRWIFTGKSLHFPKKSSVNPIHQITRRHQAIRSIEQSEGDDLHFSSVFTLSTETFVKLKKSLLQYIEDSHGEIHASGADDVYVTCLDLFRAK